MDSLGREVFICPKRSTVQRGEGQPGKAPAMLRTSSAARLVDLIVELYCTSLASNPSFDIALKLQSCTYWASLQRFRSLQPVAMARMSGPAHAPLLALLALVLGSTCAGPLKTVALPGSLVLGNAIPLEFCFILVVTSSALPSTEQQPQWPL